MTSTPTPLSFPCGENVDESLESDKFGIWNVWYLKSSVSEKFDIWKIQYLKSSVSKKFGIWKISISENSVLRSSVSEMLSGI